jgi:hypothetical protein
MKKTVLFSLISIFFLHSSLKAEEYGWLNKITNNSSNFVRLITFDTGHNPRVIIEPSEDMKGCPEGDKDLQIGCKPFIIKPKQSIKLSGYAIPWEKVKNQKSNAYIIIEVLNPNGSIKKGLYLQDKNGWICTSTNDTWSSPMEPASNYCHWEKKGDLNFEVEITNKAAIQFKKQ